MGGCGISIPKNLQAQWKEISVRGKKLMQNQNTQELFQVFVIPKQENTKNLPRFVERSIYSIPHTPKVIILNETEREMFLLVQQFGQPIAEYLSEIALIIDILDLLSKITRVLQCLFKKYGPFYVREKMIGINKNADVMAWINSQKQKNFPEYPLKYTEECQRLMIDSVVTLFCQVTKSSLPSQVLNHGCLSFQAFHQHLDSLIGRSKLEPTYATGFKSNRSEKYILRGVSPEATTSYRSRGNIKLMKSQTMKTMSRIDKRNDVPQFLKTINAKKIGFMSTIDHRRKVTIQDSVEMQKGINRRGFTNQKNDKDRKVRCSRSQDKAKYRLGVQKKASFNNMSSGQNSNNSSPTAETIEKWNESVGSSAYSPFKKREVGEGFAIKPCEQFSKPLRKLDDIHQINSEVNTPAVKEIKLSYWSQNDQSIYFDANSKQKLHQNNSVAHSRPRTTLGLNSNICESKYISEMKNEGAIIEEESRTVSKNLEDEFAEFFSNHSRSPRLSLGVMKESETLAQEFGAVIDF